MKRGLAMVLFLLVVVMAGCDVSGQPATDTVPTAAVTSIARARVDAVHVVRLSDVPQGNLPSFDHTGRDAAKAQALFDGLLALPVYTPRGPCPTDSGVQYQLTFSQGGATVLSAVADPSSCQVVVLGPHDNRTALHSNIWPLLAAAVGVPESTVYPLS